MMLFLPINIFLIVSIYLLTIFLCVLHKLF